MEGDAQNFSAREVHNSASDPNLFYTTFLCDE